jgi:uncharacterized protein DUF4167
MTFYFGKRAWISEQRAALGRCNRGLAKTQAMRNGQNKRMRGRNRKTHNPLTRVYESNGPDVKIRGTASHVAEKYVQLARDAQSSGDPVSAENYLQHAEHYFRLIALAQEQFRQTTPFFRADGSTDRDDMGDDGDEDAGGQPGVGEQPSFGPRDPQPYLPRDAQFYAPREQPDFPREQQNYHREQHNSGRDQHNSGRGQQNHHREQQHAPREQQNYGGRQQHNSAPHGNDDDGNVERLPSFITGGGGAPAPQQAAAPPAHQGGYGQNGFEGQGDRFPLHRRRRRHRGPRNDMAQGGQSEGDEAPQGPRPNGE